MTKKVRNYAIGAVGSVMLVCLMAGTSLAYGPGHNGPGYGNHNKGPGYNCGNFAGHRGGQYDTYLVDQGIPAATVNAFMTDKDKFRTENRAALEAMRAKGLELYEEMSKAAPDAAKAKALQAELSKMRSDFDAKSIEHQLHLKTTYPQVCEVMQQGFKGKGFGPGNGPGGRPGPGPGFHHNGPGPRN